MITRFSPRAVAAISISATLILSSTALAATVYTETNSASDNQVQIYVSEADGALEFVNQVSTGGLGSGAGLGNQGALALSTNHRWLFAVNAGSDDISSFAIGRHGLTLIGKVPSNGTTPISVTVHGDLLYVLNSGNSGNIAGFAIRPDGHLAPITDSSRPLSSATAGPAQIGFSRDGEALVVTEKSTNNIVVYPVDEGHVGSPIAHSSHGLTPFGFAFDRLDDLLVSEAFGGKADASALSSYDLDDDSGGLSLVSGSVPSDQTAACWVVTARHGRYAYVTNTGSGTTTGYHVARNGELTRLDPDGRTGITGGGPTDAAADRTGEMLHVLSPSIGQIVTFHVRRDGSLVRRGSALGAPATATGLVAW